MIAAEILLFSSMTVAGDLERAVGPGDKHTYTVLLRREPSVLDHA
jgi:hypothetical protein